MEGVQEEEEAKYAIIIYKGYEFKIDKELIIDSEKQSIEEDNTELKEYKEKIAETLTTLGIKTSYIQTSDNYINNIKILADKNLKEGKESDIVLIKSNLNSRYIQTLSLANIEDYENFDEEDFIIVNKNMVYANYSDAEDISAITKSYNKQTGELILGKQKNFASKFSWTFWNNYDLYAIKRKNEIIDKSNSTNNKKETLMEFKYKIAKTLEEYGIENDEESPIIDKSKEEISEYIKAIARKKFNEGVSTFMVLIKDDLSSRDTQTVLVTNLEGYTNLTIDDFLIVNKNMLWIGTNDREDITTMSKSYEQNTGTLSFGKQKSYSDIFTFYNSYKVYFLKKKVINLEEYVQI